MARFKSEQAEKNAIRLVSELMAASARTAPKARGVDDIETLILDGDDLEELAVAMEKEAGEGWTDMRREAMVLLQEEEGLQEIVRLVGLDALSHTEQLLLLTTKLLREDYLQQNAFDDIDAFTSLKKMYLMLKAVSTFYHHGKDALERGVDITQLRESPMIEKIARAKTVTEDKLEELEKLITEISASVDGIQAQD